uniref:NADH-ubiquinone oxidoreductase chain 6 n=1 Tax=Pandalus borealis TaxID=6703 RepID=A0A348AE64_PANBO|nr:NADH dehydrogenase subunit 6 [Pandalus borealis]
MYLLFFTSLTILTISLLFISVKHPLAAGMALLIQTICICLAAGLQNKDMWFSYILFLIFLGAMLVLFIYVASLASNEAFNFSMTSAVVKTMTTMIVVFFYFISDPLIMAAKQSIQMSYLTTTTFLSSQQLTLSMVYNPAVMPLTMFIILFLLMTLIVVVKLTCTFFGPLRLS